MVHEPLLEDGIAGGTSSVKSISEALSNVKAEMIKILSMHTGRTEAEIEQISSSEAKYFNAEQSIEYGFADKIVGFDELWKIGEAQHGS